jgi:alpha-tubulin suppressor-like RCC1 family protein
MKLPPVLLLSLVLFVGKNVAFAFQPAISAGTYYSLFLKADGSAWATGWNSNGQLGDGTLTERSTPIQVMANVSAISASDTYSYFLKSDGTFWATGRDYLGGLYSNSPRQYLDDWLGISSIIARGFSIDVGEYVFANNGLLLKGDACYVVDFEYGSSYYKIPVITGVSAISASGAHSLFLKTDGTVWAIGLNYLGELGDEKEKKEHEETEKGFKDLLEKMKTVLVDKAKDVRVTFRLTDSPACLVADENELSGNLLRMLKAAGQQAPDTKPILEINPEHPLLLKLKYDDKQFDEWTNVLFDQALLAEGGQLNDPAGFVKRINQLLLNQ